MPTPKEPTPRQRRAAIARSVLRALVAAALLVVLYYVAPLDSALGTRPVLLLTGCLAVLVALATWRIRGIAHSEYPELRAVETLGAVVPLYILTFATAYYLAERMGSANFGQPMNRTGALYFSVTVFSTVGFGDITAKTDAARLIVTAQMLLDLIVLGFGVRVFLKAVSLGHQQHTPDQPE